VTEPRVIVLDEPPPAPAEAADGLCYECDLCGEQFAGTPPSSGMLMWTRGDEIRTEEPPLCQNCSERLSLGALLSFDEE
jgi:hypothetical protein